MEKQLNNWAKDTERCYELRVFLFDFWGAEG